MNCFDCDCPHVHLPSYTKLKETATTVHSKRVSKGKDENSREKPSGIEELLFKEQQLNCFLEEENLFLRRERIKWLNLEKEHNEVLQENQKLKLQLKEQEEKLNDCKLNYEIEVKNVKSQIYSANKLRNQNAKSYAELKNDQQRDTKKQNFLIQLENRVSMLEKETSVNKKSQIKNTRYDLYAESSIRANRSNVEEPSSPIHLTPYRSRNNLHGHFGSIRDREDEINCTLKRRVGSHSEYPEYCPTCNHTHLKSTYN